MKNHALLNPLTLISAEHMYALDRAAIASGISEFSLMQRAGKAVADTVQAERERMQLSQTSPVIVLCGPGNNGGDGFVAAQWLHEQGYNVAVACLTEEEKLQGSAADAAGLCTAKRLPFHPSVLKDASLLIDALFGAGLSRPLGGNAAEMAEAINASSLPVIAVDIPSGIHADSGQVMGYAIRAEVTVTFNYRKPGHLLYPGKSYCGRITVADIGLGNPLPEQANGICYENHPFLWHQQFPFSEPLQHKYSRGMALVYGTPPERSGASRLAAISALRAGAGLVAVACPQESMTLYGLTAAALLLKRHETPEDWEQFVSEERVRAAIIGPGAGVSEPTRRAVLASLKQKRATVLDADALTVFAENPELLRDNISEIPCILTPHNGEFTRLFGRVGAISEVQSKLAKAKVAARWMGATLVFKGADTVIASPDGRAVINQHATPELATAGSGDVLTGICGGLLAQGMPAFEAACAAVWLHGEAAIRFGAGLIADDLPNILPQALSNLKLAALNKAESKNY
jgi:NAD(P)H-hydrate epimerase